MSALAPRQNVFFDSGDSRCAAWHYPGTNGACIIMAPGLAVTKEPATDPFAPRFQEAGYSVLAFDFRHFGDSGGEPRQILKIKEQHADLDSAIAFAGGLPEVDPSRLVLWGFSLSGGHVLAVASRHQRLAAAIAVSPNASGPAAARNATGHQTRFAMIRTTCRAIADAAHGVLGRPPLLIPLAGDRGTVALLTALDARNGNRALNPANRYPEWQQQIAARAAISTTLYRPGRHSAQIRCPLFVIAHDQDDAALAQPAIDAGAHAPLGEVLRFPGGHYEPYLAGRDRTLETQLAFLDKHLDETTTADRQAGALTAQ